MADVARETGLTLGTVSRALSKEGKYAVAPETRERVSEAASRLGYRPNLIGRALASGSAALVLLISPDPFAPYYVEISRHLSRQAAGHGYSFVTGGALTPPDPTPDSTGGETGISPSDWLYGVDGIIVSDFLSHQEAYIREAMRLKIPMVGLGVRYSFPSDFVQVDLRSASEALVRHLLDRGAVRPAMISASGTDDRDPRRAAYREVLEARGIAPRFLEAKDQSRASGRRAILDGRLVEEGFDAVFCENDVLAVGAYRGLTDLGLRVPDDVLLAGCDGLDDALYQSTPITTISQPIERMCQAAWTMLQERIEGHAEPERTIRFAAELQTRASTGL